MMNAVLKISNSSQTTRIEFSDLPIVKPYLKTLVLQRDGYVYLSKDTHLKLHRLVCQPQPQSGEVVDHISRDRLDNRRSNLRPATLSQNALNRKPRGKYKGVSYRTDKGKFEARAKNPNTGKNKHLGYFPSDREAAVAYNDYMVQMGLSDYAYINDVDFVDGSQPAFHRFEHKEYNV